MSKPKISVLIPAYNHGSYLRDTIESVLNQTFTDFELLISDDFSTDDTADIIRSYSDDRIIPFFFSKNIGTVRSLNRLLDAATGEYIAVLGSDDLWIENKLKQQLEVLENNSSLAACFSYATIIDMNSKPITDEKLFPVNIFNLENAHKSSMLKTLFDTGNHLCHSSVLMRKSVHDKIGKYNVAYRQLHDFDLWVRLLIKYEIHIIESPLVKYRFVADADNISQNTYENSIRLFNEAEEIIYFLLENISDKDFIEGFAEYFVNKNAHSAAQIVCEKIFLLNKKQFWSSNNTSLAVTFLLKHLNDEVLQCFEESYGISLKDLYDFTGVLKTDYPDEFYFEMPIYKNRLNEIYSSASWKITKPIRKISGKIKSIKEGFKN